MVVSLVGCQKYDSAFEIGNQEIENQENTENPQSGGQSLNSIEMASFLAAIDSFDLVDEIDTGSIRKYDIIDNNEPTGQHMILAQFFGGNNYERQTLSALQIGGVTYSATVVSIKVQIVSNYRSIVTYMDLSTGWGKIFDKQINETVLVDEIVGTGEKPTFWECMEDEVRAFTNTIAGVIAISVYPEPILGMMAAKCAWIVYGN